MFASLIITLSVISGLPEANAGGRIISVEDAFASRKVYPAIHRYYWQPDGTPGRKRPQEKIWTLPANKENISYGGTISRNEFGISKTVFPSPDGRTLAVYWKDESRVSVFPLLDISSRTGTLVPIRYPMNGMPSERVGLSVCDTLGNVICNLQVTDFDSERYITNVSWSPDGKYIFAQIVDRPQHHSRLNMYRSSDGAFVRTILCEANEKWTEPLDPVHFIKGSYRFIYRTDNRDGYRNLYVCDTLGHVSRLTATDADVQYAGNDGKWVYYTSAEVSPVENHLFRIRVNGKKKERLTSEPGWHSISLNGNCTQFIDSYSSFAFPGAVCLKSADGKLIRELERAEDPLKEYARCEAEMGTVKSADGRYDNWYRLFKPLNFDPSKKYPLIVYLYGGPHSQMVQNRWLGGIRMWEMIMAQKGYVVYVQDNRGTSNRGAEFEKAINRQCGKAESEDQKAGLDELLKNPWIDRSRIGIMGWSYGGFMTLTMMTSYPDIFKVGVAGGPVIDWKWYEVMYGERYMDTEATNPEGFAASSLMNRTDRLKGRLMICQGAIDNTVVWQHSLNFVNECILKGIQLDYFPYPTSEHNMVGKARVHLYNKITSYFEEHL